MLWLQMGLGKTIITLTVIVDLMRAGKVSKTIVFGPIRVINSVWTKELSKWAHTQHLKVSIIRGTPQQRARALFRNADMYLINYELMNWFVGFLEHYYKDKPFPFECVVYDEISKLKNSTSLRFRGGVRDRKDKKTKPNQEDTFHKVKYLGWRRMINKFKYRYGLTGTPASNGYLDLHGQYLALDGGKRLGEYVTHYKNAYFRPKPNGWGVEIASDYHQSCIEAQISDITIKMDSKDYLDMPDVIVTNIMVELPKSLWPRYKEIERDMFTYLDSGTEVEVFGASGKSNKCLQMANGNIYTDTETKTWEPLHDVKLHALEDILEEAGGSPVLCSYSFIPDAKRIMSHFKKYKPVNLTGESANKTQAIIDKWNRGEIKLLIGHPACLHPSTQLLTERRGWVKLIDVRRSDRVFDGVEFVNHEGCRHSGYKKVVDTFGVTMTLDHKLLIDGEWEQAQNVRSHRVSRTKALYKYKGADKYLIEMFKVRSGVPNSSPERKETQQVEKNSLSELHNRSLPLQNKYSNMANMVWYEKSMQGYFGQELRRSWNRNVQRMGSVRDILQRHVRRVFEQFNNRKTRREQRLLERQLHLGDNVYSARKQTKNSTFNLPRGEGTLSRIMSSHRGKQNEVNYATESRTECRQSRGRRSELKLREKSETCEHKATGKTHVYDLVNCGPRHRFLIKNDEGDVFVSHNSMSHGIDGLQQNGSIVVWFGLTWSFEHYEQMNARINRQGQTKPVSIIQILCKNTVDIVQLYRLEGKDRTQQGLKNALDKYRGKEEPTFLEEPSFL